MKRVRIILELILIVALSFAAMPNEISAASADPDLIFEDDFTGYEGVGAPPAGWTSVAVREHMLSSAEVDAAHGTSACINNGTSAEEQNARLIRALDTPVTAGMVKVSFELRKTSLTTTAVVRFTNSKNENSSPFTAVQFTTAGKITLLNVPTADMVYNYVANKWYKFDIILDMTERRAIYYIDGEEVARATTNTNSFDSLEKIAFWQWSAGNGALYVDNVSVRRYNTWPTKNDDLVFEDDFNNYIQDGEVPGRWTNITTAIPHLVTSENIDSEHGISLGLASSSSDDNSYVVKEFVVPVKAGQVIVSYDVRKNNTNNTLATVFTNDGTIQNETQSFTALQFSNTGAIIPRNATGSTPSYNADTWYRVDIELDMDSRTAVYYIDGQRIAIGPTTELASFNRIYFKHYNKVDGGQSYIDNVLIKYHAPDPIVVNVDFIKYDDSVLTGNQPKIAAGTKEIDVTFNATMNESSLNTTNILLDNQTDGVNVNYISEYDAATKTYKLKFDDFLAPNKSYKLSLSTAVENSRFVGLLEQYDQTFETDSGDVMGIISMQNNSIGVTQISDLSEGDTVTISAELVNATSVDQEFLLVDSAYNLGELVDSRYTQIDMLSTEKRKTVSVTKEIINLSDIDGIKVFLLHGYVSLSPMTQNIAVPYLAVGAISGADENFKASVDFTTGQVTLIGKTNQAQSDKMISLTLLRPSKTIGDLKNATDALEAVAYNDQTITDNNGDYVFSFKLDIADEVSGGIYTAYIGIEGASTPVKYEFLVVSREENKKALDILLALTDANAVLNNVKNNKDVLGFTMPLFESVNQNKVSEYLLERMGEGDLNSTNGQMVINAFEQLVIIQALNQSKITDLDDYINTLGINNGEIANWYNEDHVTDSMENLIVSRISNKSLTNVPSLQKEFEQAVVLEIIKNPNGYGNVKRVIEAFSDDIGVTTAGVKDTVYQNLSGKSFSDYGELKSEFISMTQSDTSYHMPSGGSTGGGGGGGGKISNVAIAKEYAPSPVPTEPVTPIVPAEPVKSFVDIDHVPWAIDAILDLQEKGIITGKSENEFYPNDNITREECVKLIVKAFGYNEEYIDTPFDDVREDSWFYAYVSTAFKNGICKGISDSMFGSGHMITREDLAVMIYNALETKEVVLDQLVAEIDFADSLQIASYAKEAVKELQKGGIINGVGDGMFQPKGYASRAQTAKILHLLLPYLR